MLSAITHEGESAEMALSSRCRPLSTPGRIAVNRRRSSEGVVGQHAATMVLPMFGPSSPSSPSGGSSTLPHTPSSALKPGPSRAQASMRQSSPLQRMRPSPLNSIGDAEGFWPATPMSASQTSTSRTISPPRVSPLYLDMRSGIPVTPQRRASETPSASQNMVIESLVAGSPSDAFVARERRSSNMYKCPNCGQRDFVDAQSAAAHCLGTLSSSPRGDVKHLSSLLESLMLPSPLSNVTDISTPKNSEKIACHSRSLCGRPGLLEGPKRGSFQVPVVPSVSLGFMTPKRFRGSVPHASEVSFRCPCCGQGQFQDAESAAMHCRASEMSAHLTREVREEPLGYSPSGSTTSYTCPTCKEKGFADALSAAMHCGQMMGTSSFSPIATQANGVDHSAPRPRSGSPILARRTGLVGTPPSVGHHRMHTRRTSPTRSFRNAAVDGESLVKSYASMSLPQAGLGGAALQQILSTVSARRQRKIERHVDQDSGHAQTIVHNEDGTCIAFGESSVCSLVESEETEAKKLIDSLNDFELQGLVHELNQRLLKTAGDYEALQKELDRFEELCDLAFFGLDQTSTVKDLDKAYRKLARKLHPDKNGNTEEAKLRFIDMKERYERLKKKLKNKKEQEKNSQQEAKDPNKDAHATTNAEFAPNCEVPDFLPTEPIVLPDLNSAGPKQDSRGEQEKLDRDKLDDACWKILRRTKAFVGKVNDIHRVIDETKKELEHFRNGDHIK